MRSNRRRASTREAGNTLVVMAFFMASLLILLMVGVDLIQVRQAQVMVETAAQDAAVDGARVDLQASTLIPRCPPLVACEPALVLAIPDTTATREHVRQSLARNLASVAYLMEGTTPDQVAAQAEMVVVNPQGGRCMPSPLSIGPARGPCYYDPFVAVRVTVPLKALWGATHFQYRVAVVGALTDNPTVQQPPTPIPTSTPGPIPTWPVPGPTCRPSDC